MASDRPAFAQLGSAGAALPASRARRVAVARAAIARHRAAAARWVVAHLAAVLGVPAAPLAGSECCRADAAAVRTAARTAQRRSARAARRQSPRRDRQGIGPSNELYSE